MKKLKLLSVLWLILPSLAYGADNGKLHGQITDKATGEPIYGATIRIEGTKLANISDLEGRYAIGGIPTGTYTVTVSYISYLRQVFSGIKIDGNDQLLNVMLAEAMDTLTGVTIGPPPPTQGGGNTLYEFQQFQFKNPGMADGIPGDAMKNMPGVKGASDALTKVSGATVQDNKFVTVRGLSDRYNTALINGLPLPTSEPDRRAFSFDLFPSAMLDNLVIFKTAQPDLPGEFAGGVIQLKTRDIPEEPFISFSSGTGYNTISTFKEYRTYNGGKTDWLGIDDGVRGFPGDIPDTKTFKELLASPSDRYWASKLFPNDWALSNGASSPLSQSYQFSLGTNAKVFKNDFGVIGALMYSNTRKTVFVERGDFNIDTTRIYRYTDTQYKQNVSSGAMLNLTYKIGEHNKISLKNMLSVNGEDMVVERTGANNEMQKKIRANSMQFTSTRLFSTQLSGNHVVKKSDIKISWGASYSNLTRDLPNLRRMYYSQNFGDTVYTAYVPYVASPNYAGKYFSMLDEKMYAGNADVKVPFKIRKQKQSFKVGGAVQRRERSFDARIFGYAIGNSALFNYNLLNYGQDSIFDHENIGPNGFKLQETTNNQDSYTAGSELYSAYMMFDNKLFKKLRMVWGGRYEHYGQHLNTIAYGGDTVNIDTAYADVLPSVNFTYEVKEGMNVRLSGSRTVARPEFRELAPFSYYDFNTSSSVYGNKNLKRTLVTNLDARFEYHPGRNQMFSATAFYKDFKDPIEQIIDASSGAGSRTYTYANVIRAQNFGAELEFRVKLSGLDSLFKAHCRHLDNITWFSNLAWIHSELDLSNIASLKEEEKHRPLQGQSPYIINTGIQYITTNKKFLVSVLYNRIGRRISQVGSNGYLSIYEAPRNMLDAKVSFKAGRYLDIALNAVDILHNEVIFYQDQDGSGKYEAGGKDTKFTGMNYGSNYSLSLSVKF